jgi:hypothetical protein
MKSFPTVFLWNRHHGKEPFSFACAWILCSKGMTAVEKMPCERKKRAGRLILCDERIDSHFKGVATVTTVLRSFRTDLFCRVLLQRLHLSLFAAARVFGCEAAVPAPKFERARERTCRYPHAWEGIHSKGIVSAATFASWWRSSCARIWKNVFLQLAVRAGADGLSSRSLRNYLFCFTFIIKKWLLPL